MSCSEFPFERLMEWKKPESRRHVSPATDQDGREAPRTFDGRNDVVREDVGVDEVLLALEVLDDLEVRQRPRVPCLVPKRVEVRCALIRVEDVRGVLLQRRGGEPM